MLLRCYEGCSVIIRTHHCRTTGGALLTIRLRLLAKDSPRSALPEPALVVSSPNPGKPLQSEVPNANPVRLSIAEANPLDAAPVAHLPDAATDNISCGQPDSRSNLLSNARTDPLTYIKSKVYDETTERAVVLLSTATIDCATF